MYNATDKKKDRIPALKELLSTDARWAVRGLLAIYDYQTEEEKAVEYVGENNGVGFTSSDGEILTSFAKQVEKGRIMSEKQMNLIHKKMPKYAGQLDRVVQAKTEAK